MKPKKASEDMPREIWAYETNCKNSKGFGHWYDQDVSGEGVENKCTKYVRHDKVPTREWLESRKITGVDTEKGKKFIREWKGFNAAIDMIIGEFYE